MERLAYLIKHRFPALFRLVGWLAERVTTLRYGRRIRRAEERATLDGEVAGQPALMRALQGSDVGRLHAFLTALPADHLRYFRPHGFDVTSLRRVLLSRAFLNYGLFVGEDLVGYALLKVAPTGSAFIGLLVHPDFLGKGLGTFITRFLYWQAAVAGLRARSTICRDNTASLRSHQAVADYRIVAELPNDYLLIEFPEGPPKKPRLNSQ